MSNELKKYHSAVCAIREIARKEGKTEQEIRDAMQKAINESYCRAGADARKRWEQISSRRGIPTPEEFIIWAGSEAKRRMQS